MFALKYKEYKGVLKIKNIDDILLLDLDEETIVDQITKQINKLNEFVDKNLKYIPKSDFIYSKEILTEEEIKSLGENEKNILIKKLYEDNYRVYKENEQFRTQNLKQHIKLKKLETLGGV